MNRAETARTQETHDFRDAHSVPVSYSCLLSYTREVNPKWGTPVTSFDSKQRTSETVKEADTPAPAESGSNVLTSVRDEDQQTAEVAFAGWRCHCTILAKTMEEIPDRCPTHAKGLLGPAEWVRNTHKVPLGVQLSLYEAVMHAADHIERQPHDYDFEKPLIPKSGGPASALAWIHVYSGIKGLGPAGRTADSINLFGVNEDEFCKRMNEAVGPQWQEEASVCASGLRLFARTLC